MAGPCYDGVGRGEACRAEPANFLGHRRRAKADIVTVGLGLILSDANITVLMINIFGGITRCDEVAAESVAPEDIDLRYRKWCA